MTEPLMTEKTGVSMGLVMCLIGLSFSVAGSWAFLQSGQTAINAEQDKQAARLDRLEREQSEQAARNERMMRDLGVILCATDDRIRADACEKMGVLR